MVDKEHISKQIWTFLDGNGSDEERMDIEKLITSDNEWINQYQDILHVQKQLIELSAEQPTMRFTKNILERLPFSKNRFIQPKGLLSYKAKVISVSFFLAALAIGFASYLPDLIITGPSSKYLFIQSGFKKFIQFFNFEMEVSLYTYIILGALLIIVTDHLITEWPMKEKSSIEQ